MIVILKRYSKCNDCYHDCCCDCCGQVPIPVPYNSEYAFFSQSGRLYNTALFGGINLNNEGVFTSGFIYDATIVNIINPGVYIATYFINIPYDAIVNTNFVIQLNNQSLVGSASRVNKISTDSPYSAVGQAIFKITGISSMRISSSSIIDINSDSSSDTVASLTIVKISD